MKSKFQKTKEVPFSVYLARLESLGIAPNFWCSEEYIDAANWSTLCSPTDTLWVVDEEYNIMLPGIGMDSGEYGFWAGFSELLPPKENAEIWDFLDYEFIYMPSRFLSIEGPEWSASRKNMRWAVQDAGEPLWLQNASLFAEKDTYIETFFGEWMEANESTEIYDPEVLVKYIYAGRNRLFLRGLTSGKVYGIIAWDDNFKYINFRYCLVLPNIRGLSDLARITFYRYIARLFPEKLVNDGGSLGNPGLERYKKRLNPITINSIYSREVQ